MRGAGHGSGRGCGRGHGGQGSTVVRALGGGGAMTGKLFKDSKRGNETSSNNVFSLVSTPRKSQQLLSKKNAASSTPSASSIHHNVRETSNMILRLATMKSASKIPNQLCTKKSRSLISSFEALTTMKYEDYCRKCR
jgi:hypothetical protein